MQALGNRTVALRRDVFALAVAAVREAVVWTHQVAVFDPALGERRTTMRTDIACRHELAVRPIARAKHNQPFVQQRHAKGLVFHVRGERHRMPVAAEYVPVVAIESAVARLRGRALKRQRGYLGGSHVVSSPGPDVDSSQPRCYRTAWRQQ